MVAVSAAKFVRDRFAGGGLESLTSGSERTRFKEIFFLVVEVRTVFEALEEAGEARFGTRCLADFRNGGSITSPAKTCDG